ncbi:MAG TPA: DUF1772 domain-containing protein [Cyclobacteriaceae bacterium]|jgi:hypothetical protein|nr:DUF1772 domain-containing protein [Cyclobacteriaceae bacterium]
MIQKIVLFMSILVASGILAANVYTSLVDAKSWGSNIPESLQTTRAYFKVVTPARFFRIVSPLNQVLAVLALILFWKAAPSARGFLATALGCYVLTDVFTFAYFYPRNDIMFVTGTDPSLMSKAWSEWNAMNWVRSLVIFVGVCASFFSLDRIYSS